MAFKGAGPENLTHPRNLAHPSMKFVFAAQISGPRSPPISDSFRLLVRCPDKFFPSRDHFWWCPCVVIIVVFFCLADGFFQCSQQIGRTGDKPCVRGFNPIRVRHETSS